MNIDFRNSKHIIFFGIILPFLSFGLSWIFYQVFPNAPFWLETISPVYAYGLIYSLFDKHLWTWGIFKKLGIVTVPDLRGRWKGKLRSSYKEGKKNKEISACLEIKQTYSKVIVCIYYEKSQSESVKASFVELNGEVYLFYTYDSEPNSLKVGTMQSHKGTVKLRLLPNENKLIGFYFNSIGNSGELFFEYEQAELYCRFSE